MRRKFVAVCLVVALVSTVLTGCTIGKKEVVVKVNALGRNHVISINGDRCTKEEAKLYLCNFQNIYGNAYGLNLWESITKEKKEELENYIKDITISELSNIMCMEQIAKQQGITLTEAELEKVKKATDEYYESLSRQERSYMGIDKNKLRGFYEKYALAQKLYSTLTQTINEEVSEDEARVIKIQQIFVKNKDVALVIQNKLDAGESFELLASNYNETSIVEKHLARGEYPKEVDKVAFYMDNDEISSMISTDEGYYFIKCLNKFEKKLTEENKEKIIVKRRKEQFDDKFVEFVENSDFNINKKNWERIHIDTSGDITTESFFEVYNKYFKQ